MYSIRIDRVWWPLSGYFNCTFSKFYCEFLRHAMFICCATVQENIPRAFSVSNQCHAAVACTVGIWAGGLDPSLSNRRATWAERRPPAANRRRSRQRQPRLRVLRTREPWTSIVRREATCWSVPLAWKNCTLTFSVDYKETGKAMMHYLVVIVSQNGSKTETASRGGDPKHT